MLVAAALITTTAGAGAFVAVPTARAEPVFVNLFPPSGNDTHYGNGLGTYAVLNPVPNGGTVSFTADGIPIPGCTNFTDLLGQIVCNHRWLEPDTYSVQAHFSGFGSYEPGSSVPQDITVRRMSTELAYTGPTSTMRNQSFTASAHLTPMFGSFDIVGETVTFALAGGGSCNGVTDADGIASCALTMTPDSSTLTITYAGTEGYGDETITANITALGGPTTTWLTASPSSAPVGASIHLSVTVDPPQATGTTTIRNGASPIAGCTNLPLVGGAASCDTTGLPDGSNTLTAVYNGNGVWDGSTSQPTNVIMSKHAVELTPGGAPIATVGSPYQLEATLHDVTLDVPAAGQTITFTLAAQSCTGVTNAAGTASCTVTPTAAGNASPTYTYAGSATYLPDSASKPITVLRATTTTTATSAGGTYLAPVHLDAVVSPSDGQGTVAFYDGATEVAGCGAVPLALVTGSWRARCTTSALTVGTHPVTAVFSGSANYTGSTSAVTNVSIAPAFTTTILSGPATAPYSGVATYTATVSPDPGGGTVAFRTAGGGALGCDAQPVEAGGQATCSVAIGAIGNFILRGTFSGTATHAGSFDDLTVTLTPAPTTLTYTGPTNGVVGEPMTVTATLEAFGQPVDPGQPVTFSLELGGSCTDATDAAGVASCVLTPTAASGDGDLDIDFTGNSHYVTSTDEASVHVAAAATETSLTGPTSAEFGDTVQLVATVGPTDGGGTVMFTIDGDAIPGCEAVDLSGPTPWHATCTAAALPAGSLEIVAAFSGTADYLTSDDHLTVHIVPADAVVTYVGDLTGTVDGPLTLSGALAAELGGDTSPLAAQTLTFGLADLSCTAVTGPDGTASCTVTPDAVAQSGTATVTFGGSAEFAPAAAEANVSIAPAATSTSLTGRASSLFSVPTTFVAAISRTDGGTVAFSAGGAPIPGCEAAAVTVESGSGQATCTTSALGVGSREIAAQFSGTANYLASTAEPVTIAIAVAPTSLTYTGPQTATAGEPITVSARLLVDQASASSAALAARAAPLAAGDVPVVGQTLTFQLVDASCTATTDATGTASCTLTPTTSAASSELRITFAGGDGFAAAEEVIAVAVAAAPIPPTTPAPTTPAPPPNPGTLPATGGSGTPIGQAAAALMVAGLVALAVALGRPRRRCA